jgi:hypothetical protein
MNRPFRAQFRFFCTTQGFALGWSSGRAVGALAGTHLSLDLLHVF